MDNNRKLAEDNPINKKSPRSKKRSIKKTKVAKFKPSQNGSKKNLIVIGAAVLIVIIISALIFSTLTSLFSTESYYVLNTNIKAKERITPDMVVMRETAAGTGPVNALKMEHIQRGDIYSRYPLYAGDVVAYSNAGVLSGQTLGIPDDWSVTSFSISSTDAVGGILGKGDYVDLLGVNEEEGARYIAYNMLILDVKFVNEQYDGNVNGETIIGELMHYTVGMPAKEVALLHSALLSYKNTKVIKAPYLLNYAKRDVSDLDTAFKYGPEIGNIDLFLGSDPTFTDVERDETGRPIKVIEEQNQDNYIEDKDGSELPVIEEELENENEIIEIEVEEVETEQGN